MPFSLSKFRSMSFKVQLPLLSFVAYWDSHIVAGILGGLLNAGTSTQYNQISQRNLLTAGLSTVERNLDTFEGFEHSL